ncbi:MAG TPA: hypothetical protein VLF71_04910 [Candidatus Saccharimonadales bacterium]|nr:hypothetical protein [Candidatus Saccharimonadales bacterium]
MRRNTLFATGLALLFIIFGTIFGVVQQVLRSGANDPQIQMAENVSASLEMGVPTSQLITGVVRLNANLAPFVMVYDKAGNLLSGNALIGKTAAKIPPGVLTAADGRDYNALTWQPQPDIRVATVTVASEHYYVVSGRSLKEVEKREQQTLNIALFGGVAAAAILLAGFLLDMRLRNRQADGAAATPVRQARRQKPLARLHIFRRG